MKTCETCDRHSFDTDFDNPVMHVTFNTEHARWLCAKCAAAEMATRRPCTMTVTDGVGRVRGR